MKKSIRIAALQAALLLMITLPAFAGWVEIDMEGNRTLFSDGKIKDAAEGETTWSIFDTTTGELTMVDDEHRVYTRAEVDDFCQAIQEATKEALARMSPEERDLMEQMMGAMQERDAEAAPAQITVEELGEGEEIAGYKTEVFRIMVDGRPYQELWIAADAPVIEEINVSGLLLYQKEMSACLEEATPWSMGPSPEASPAYEGVMKRGWVMRSMQFGGAGEIVSRNEVARLEEQQIGPAEFEVPSDYRSTGVREFMEERH